MTSSAARRRPATLLRPLGPIWSPFLDRPIPVLVGFLCVPLAALLLLALPDLAGRMLDVAKGGAAEDRDRLYRLAAWFAAAALGEALLRLVSRKLLIDASRRAEASLKARLERRLVRLPIPWFERAGTGDIISTTTQDVELLRFATGPAVLYAGQALIVVPGSTLLIASSSPWVALAAAVALSALVFALWRLAPGVQRCAAATQDAIAAIAQHASEAFAGVRVLQAFHRMSADAAAMRHLGEGQRNAAIDLARARARVNLAIHLAVEGVFVAALTVGAIEAIRGRISIGDLLEYYAAFGIVLPPLLATGFVFTALPRALAAGRRVQALLSVETEVEGGHRPLDGGGSVSVRNLTVTRTGGGTPMLDDVSFELPAGAKLGLVGPVGSGKSTLLGVLLRFRDPPPRTVFVDGHDVLDLDPSALRERFAVAAQDPFLFGDTIEGNIRFGGEAREPLELARAAGLGPDLEQLEAGLETVVGERGATLSGGQRQRVSLARALAADRPALILDDTLSAVDHATEREILSTLQVERRGRTAIVATHRLSAVRDADLILVLDHGRIVDRGTHDELASRSGFYADAWRRQVERNVLEGADPEESA